jgi:hypothetical protein
MEVAMEKEMIIKTIPDTKVGISDINTELGTGGRRSLGQSDGRLLAGVSSGQIGISDYIGRDAITHTVSGSTGSDSVGVTHTLDTITMNNATSVVGASTTFRFVAAEDHDDCHHDPEAYIYMSKNGGSQTLVWSARGHCSQNHTVTYGGGTIYEGEKADIVLYYKYYSGKYEEEHSFTHTYWGYEGSVSGSVSAYTG